MSYLGACSRSTPAPDGAQAPPDHVKTQDGLTLSPEEITNMGITLAPAASAQYFGETEGFGVVMGRDTIVQPLTDVVAAEAAARQSHAALARTQRLSGTSGADSATVRETAERQSSADDAALQMAEAKASSVLGQRSPWTGDKSQELIRALAAGRIRVLRLTFPLGSFQAGEPQHVRVARLDAEESGRDWRVSAIWGAPADGSMPGRSYFAVLEKSDLNEGERLLAWAADSASHPGASGAFIPASALLVSGDKYWCYQRGQNGTFVRTPVDISRPQPGGYFVADGIKPGDVIVTSGAGLLLARDTNPAVDSDP